MLPVLSGLRVIAVEQNGAGPCGSMQLANLAAAIIKVENPADNGDPLAASQLEPPPAPNVDTGAILRDCAYSASDIAALRREPVI